MKFNNYIIKNITYICIRVCKKALTLKWLAIKAKQSSFYQSFVVITCETIKMPSNERLLRYSGLKEQLTGGTYRRQVRVTFCERRTELLVPFAIFMAILYFPLQFHTLHSQFTLYVALGRVASIIALYFLTITVFKWFSTYTGLFINKNVKCTYLYLMFFEKIITHIIAINSKSPWRIHLSLSCHSHNFRKINYENFVNVPPHNNLSWRKTFKTPMRR